MTATPRGADHARPRENDQSCGHRHRCRGWRTKCAAARPRSAPGRRWADTAGLWRLDLKKQGVADECGCGTGSAAPREPLHSTWGGHTANHRHPTSAASAQHRGGHLSECAKSRIAGVFACRQSAARGPARPGRSSTSCVGARPGPAHSLPTAHSLSLGSRAILPDVAPVARLRSRTHRLSAHWIGVGTTPISVAAPTGVVCPRIVPLRLRASVSATLTTSGRPQMTAIPGRPVCGGSGWSPPRASKRQPRVPGGLPPLCRSKASRPISHTPTAVRVGRFVPRTVGMAWRGIASGAGQRGDGSDLRVLPAHGPRPHDRGTESEGRLRVAVRRMSHKL